MKRSLIFILSIIFSIALCSHVNAKVTGVCSNCHTMHNSQGGTAMGTTDAQPALLLNNCLGCHTGTNTVDTTIPYVYDSGGPTYESNTLAGGNFYWAVTDATTGHNVTGIGDINLSTPPGYDGGRAAGASGGTPGGGDWPSNTLNCAGANGCHGDHTAGNNDLAGVSGAHHANEGGSLTAAGCVATSYRFLIGIHGYEETGWEYAPNSTTHNQYKGVTRAGSDLDDTSTISWLCGECHGKFHTEAADVGSASPWLRHPTDLSLNDVSGTEYASYNGAATATAAPYSVLAPVASTDVSAILGTVDASKGGSDDTAIVTCISCHRAHGSPNSDLLRWDNQANMDGCVVCHTTKD